MIPPIHLIDQPTLAQQGFQIQDFKYLRDADFQALSEATYGEFRPARNATNQNPRGLRWGIYAHDRIQWLGRNTYSLTEDENPEEGGRTRRMDLIPEEWLRRPECERLFREVFDGFGFEEGSDQRAYEIQLSAIRYAPAFGRSATPPPPYPHRDRIDGAIVVLTKRGVIGGINRLFDNDERPLYEFELGDGQGVLLKDQELLHYVSDVQLALGAQSGHRDILIVRFAPVGR